MIPINASGIDYTVDESFFNRIDIVKEELIGDTYFIRFNSNNVTNYLSVHKNFYEPIKRNIKIDSIIK
jgi:hypothetical protein